MSAAAAVVCRACGQVVSATPCAPSATVFFIVDDHDDYNDRRCIAVGDIVVSRRNGGGATFVTAPSAEGPPGVPRGASGQQATPSGSGRDGDRDRVAAAKDALKGLEAAIGGSTIPKGEDVRRICDALRAMTSALYH